VERRMVRRAETRKMTLKKRLKLSRTSVFPKKSMSEPWKAAKPCW